MLKYVWCFHFTFESLKNYYLYKKAIESEISNCWTVSKTFQLISPPWSAKIILPLYCQYFHYFCSSHYTGYFQKNIGNSIGSISGMCIIWKGISFTGLLGLRYKNNFKKITLKKYPTKKLKKSRQAVFFNKIISPLTY